MTKRVILTIGLSILFLAIFADYTVDFEGAGETKTGYASASVTLSGLSWNMTEALIGTDADEWKNGDRSARFRGYGTSAMTMLANKTNGIGTISFLYCRYKTDAQMDWKVEYSTNNGTTWIQAGEVFTAAASDEPQTFSHTLNISGDARIRIKRATESGTSNRRLNIDDIVLSDYTPAAPLLTLNPQSLSGLEYELSQGPSAAQSYTLSGSTLNPASGTITISGAPSFEYSLDNSSFSGSLPISYTGAAVSKTIYVRLKSGLAGGVYNEDASHAGGGATAYLALNGAVTSTTLGFIESYTQDFSGFTSLETLPFGWSLSDTYSYKGDFGTGSDGGLRGNGVFGIQLTSSAPNNNLTATLTFNNQSGAAITNLNISYMGRVARNDQSGTPKWIVKVNGNPVEALEYSTAGGINELKSANVGSLNIAPGASFTISLFTTSTGTSGVRRQIGLSDLLITTGGSVPNPQILVTGSLSPFSTQLNTPSASQSYRLNGLELEYNILISAPSGFELSADDTSFYPTLDLAPDFDGAIYVRMSGENSGTFGGNIVHTSLGAADLPLSVYGTVSGGGGGGLASDLLISEYLEGSSNNKALEIFNGTGQTVELSDYRVILFSNGASTASNTLNLSGSLGHGEVLVLAHSQASNDIKALADATNSTVCSFNGNDAIALYKVSTAAYVDIFGVIGNNPGTAWTADGGYTTVDKTLVRKSSVSSGVTQNPSGTGAGAFITLAGEWDLYDRDDISHLGSHDFNGETQEVTAPTLQASNIVCYPANDVVSLEWTPGNGSRRVVMINISNDFSVPADGSEPTANPVYSGIGAQVVFNGGTQIVEGSPFNGCTVEGLSPASTYWFRVYEYNGAGSQTKYLATVAENNPISTQTTNVDNTGYYAGITGYGASLKSNLHTLLRQTHTTRFSYSALLTQIPYVDQDPANPNNIIELYTGWSIPASHSGGGTTQWNREHTWSKSHGNFGESAPAGTDLHHMRPCDSTVNSAKGNKDFDEGGNPYTDASPYPGYSGATGCNTSTHSWEPRDEDKGDVARMMMYMAIRYEATDTSYDLELVDYVNTAPSDQPYYGKLSTLLAWHVQDPPDARERMRNDRIFERQGNRNPFIDNPLYAQQIWSPVPTFASSLSQTSFVANWSAPISATRYYLQVATDSLFTSLVSGYTNYDAALNTSKSITGLSYSNTYYYRLRSYFGSGYSMYSPWMAVNLPAPGGTASLSAPLTIYEYDLDGCQIQVNLSNTSFETTLSPAGFTLLNAPSGLAIQSVQYTSPSTAILTLGFDDSDFDENHLLQVVIDASQINQSAAITSTSLTLIAYIETPLVIGIMDGSIRLDIVDVENASSYVIFNSMEPYGAYQVISSQGIFDPALPTRWIQTAAPGLRSFYKAAAIKD